MAAPHEDKAIRYIFFDGSNWPEYKYVVWSKFEHSGHADYLIKVAEGHSVKIDMKTVGTPDVNTAEDITALEARIPYRKTIGMLLHAARCTRPDIAFVVSRTLPQGHSTFGPHFPKARKRLG
jgi:hypothetical protein